MPASLSATASPVERQRVIVGTAGHIDHGKTLLIRALTGTDCDRWVEEKSRGITIDLGFASLIEGEHQIGFIDVPGHHRFLHNALAGMGGVRVVLLVVAATEGVMPQTREHLAICSLLGIPSMIVALTKIDLASPELLDLAELDVEELLEDTPFVGAPIMRVSSVTGEGMDALRAALIQRAAQYAVPCDRRARQRLPVDRAFHLRGLGVVVTGTLASGVIEVGDTLEILPHRTPVRVRSIQVHGEARETTMAGERTSLQLAGAELSDVQRGVQIVSPGSLHLSRTLCARFTLLKDVPTPLKGSQEAQFFLYSTQILGRIRPLEPKVLEPGETGLVEMRFRGPVPTICEDRIIVRCLTPATTLGGGEILDPAWRRRRGVPVQDDLARLTASRHDLFLLWALRAGYRALTLEDFAARCGMAPEEAEGVLEDLAQQGKLRQVLSHGGQERRWLPQEAYDALKQRATEVLKALFERDRLARGMARAEFARRILPRTAGVIAQKCLVWLEEEQCIIVHGEQITLPGHTIELTAEEARMVAMLEERFRTGGLTPPIVDELKEELATEGRLFQNALRYLVGEGRLLRLPTQDLLSAAVFEEMRTALRDKEWDGFSVPQFKEAFGLTRRWAIPILEYCDAVGVTQRDGATRILLDPGT